MLSRIETRFRSIERFTADASHELRAPLALIMTACEVSLRRERSREELAEVLRKIVREARHMSKLVENLLDLVRGDARRRHTELVPVDVAEMLRDLCAELTPSAEAKGLTLTTALPDDEIHVLGEGTELRRLFLILLDNAIKYTETGSIHLMLSAEGPYVPDRNIDSVQPFSLLQPPSIHGVYQEVNLVNVKWMHFVCLVSDAPMLVRADAIRPRIIKGTW